MKMENEVEISWVVTCTIRHHQEHGKRLYISHVRACTTKTSHIKFFGRGALSAAGILWPLLSVSLRLTSRGPSPAG